MGCPRSNRGHLKCTCRDLENRCVRDRSFVGCGQPMRMLRATARTAHQRAHPQAPQTPNASQARRHDQGANRRHWAAARSVRRGLASPSQPKPPHGKGSTRVLSPTRQSHKWRNNFPFQKSKRLCTETKERRQTRHLTRARKLHGGIRVAPRVNVTTPPHTRKHAQTPTPTQS